MPPITPNHSTIHRICPSCMEKQGLDMPPNPVYLTEPGVNTPRSERCCFCGFYTPFDLMVVAPAETVPHNQRSPEWMKAAHMTPEQMTGVPEDTEPVVEDTRAIDEPDSADDPRIVTPQ